MADSSSQSPVPADENAVPSTIAKPSKPPKSIGVKKPSTKPTHPATKELVVNAITSLKERNGSSLQAIKKYIASNYKLDTDKLAPFIKKYLKNAVISGKLIQTKGKGASGSFKLPSASAAKPSGEKKKKKSKPKESSKKKVKSEKKGKKTKVKSAPLTETAAAAAAATTTTSTHKAVSEKKKKHTSSTKKESKKSSAPIKSATAKHKSTKPSKVKALKAKKAPSAKKATSGATNKKSSKATKTN